MFDITLLVNSKMYMFGWFRNLVQVFIDIKDAITQLDKEVKASDKLLAAYAVQTGELALQIDSLKMRIEELENKKAEETPAPQRNFTTAADIMDRQYAVYQDSIKPSFEK